LNVTGKLLILILPMTICLSCDCGSRVLLKTADEGLPVEALDRMNRTPLHAAAANGDTTLLTSLIERGAHPNTKDIYGSTPLHEAVVNGHSEVVTLLLAHGAEVDAVRSDGTSPLHIARKSANQTIEDLLVSYGARDAPIAFPEITGEYLGQPMPGDAGVIFAPGIISTAESRDLIEGFVDGGNRVIVWRYPNDFEGDWTRVPLILMEKNGNAWTAPYPSSLVGQPWFFNREHVPDGERMIFAWTKNLDGTGPAGELYLWSSTRERGEWTEPVRLDAPINQGFDTWPSLSEDGSLFFFSRREGGAGKADIYVSVPDNGEYTTVENLGAPINTEHVEEDPFIAPDGSYLLFDSDRPGGQGGLDLYIAYREKGGGWSEPVNLGDRINTEYSECRVSVTPDGKYIFYTSSRTGNLDAYWVNANIITELRPNEFNQ
jgi:hypothetical protein